MARIIILLFTILGFCSCSKESEQIIGIKIYDYKGDYNHLASQWSRMGINTAFVSTNMATDKEFRQILKKINIKVFIIFPVFLNPEILRNDTTLFAITNTGQKARDEWVEFVCPSHFVYRKALTDNLRELIRTLDPDGISIDFIRQFVYWEKIYPDRDYKTIERACYCDSCLAGFSKKYLIKIPDSCKTTSEKAQWIEKDYSIQWDKYRCDLITSMVKELSETGRETKKGLLVNVHLVPWRESDFGSASVRVAAQDLKSIVQYTDFVSPMCYSQMIDRDPKWISDVVKDMDNRAKGLVLPSIQVYPYYISKSLTAEEFKLCIKEALKPPSRGVVFFSWPLFQKDSSRMTIVKEVLLSH